MKIELTKEEVKVLDRVLKDETLRQNIFTCRECANFYQHYIYSTEHAKSRDYPFCETEHGHCAKASGRGRKPSQHACISFELAAKIKEA